MKTKYIISAILLLAIVSCQKEKPSSVADYAIFSGKILNNTKEKVIVNGHGFLKEIMITPEGTFSDTLKITNEGNYSFIIGDERSAIHFKKGDLLDLTIDLSQFDESIKYTGIGSDANNYLAAKYLTEEQFLGTGEDADKELYKKEADAFKNKVTKLKELKNALFKNYPKIDSKFIAEQEKYNHYDYLSSLTTYKNYHPYLTKKKDFVLPEGFLEETTNLDLDLSQDFDNSTSYQQLVSSLYATNSRKKATTDSIPYYKAYIEGFSQIKSENIKNNFVRGMTYNISSSNKNSDAIYELLMNASINEEAKKKISDKYEKIKLLVKGKDSPTFDYENHKGGKTALADLKGKYVYIDIWATWCAPCKAEIPYLKNIEKLYHDKNIEFVSISIDRKKDYDKWKQMVSEKELGGLQLFADNDWKSQFVTDYQIDGIPRFILIDTEGKIVNANAPRPSDPSLTGVFNELKI